MKRCLLPFTLIGSLFLATACQKQEPKEPDPVRRKSPTAIASIQHAGTYIKIVYGQPYKKGRDIFGGLIPYNKVWRTGANEATEITTTGDILLSGKKLDAGTYALFSIPRKDSWTIILNSKLGQWGAFEYDSTYDVLRVDVPSVRTEQVAEAFTIQFEEIKNQRTHILMQWDQTDVRIPVIFASSDSTVSS